MGQNPTERFGRGHGKSRGFCGIPAAALVASNIHDANGCRELPTARLCAASNLRGSFADKAEGSPRTEIFRSSQDDSLVSTLRRPILHFACAYIHSWARAAPRAAL